MQLKHLTLLGGAFLRTQYTMYCYIDEKKQNKVHVEHLLSMSNCQCFAVGLQMFLVLKGFHFNKYNV